MIKTINQCCKLLAAADAADRQKSRNKIVNFFYMSFLSIFKLIFLEFWDSCKECLEVSKEKISGQNDDSNPFKFAPEVECANITARANNTAPMVGFVDTSGLGRIQNFSS